MYIFGAFVSLTIIAFFLRGLGRLKEESDFDGHIEREAMAREPQEDLFV